MVMAFALSISTLSCPGRVAVLAVAPVVSLHGDLRAAVSVPPDASADSILLWETFSSGAHASRRLVSYPFLRASGFQISDRVPGSAAIDVALRRCSLRSVLCAVDDRRRLD